MNNCWAGEVNAAFSFCGALTRPAISAAKRIEQEVRCDFGHLREFHHSAEFSLGWLKVLLICADRNNELRDHFSAVVQLEWFHDERHLGRAFVR